MSDPAASDYIDAIVSIEHQVAIAKRAAERSEVEGVKLERLLALLDEMEMTADAIKTVCNPPHGSASKDGETDE